MLLLTIISVFVRLNFLVFMRRNLILIGKSLKNYFQSAKIQILDMAFVHNSQILNASLDIQAVDEGISFSFYGKFLTDVTNLVVRNPRNSNLKPPAEI